MPLPDMLVLILATWYSAHAITRSAGPFGVFRALRKAAPLGGLTNCIVCAAPWLAALLLALWSSELYVVVVVLAVAGGAMLAHRYTGGDAL